MKISELLLLLVLATLPIQLNKFFFLDHSYVLGIPIDYRALSVYLSDIAILLYLTAYLAENRRNLPEIFKSHKATTVSLVVFNAYLLVTSAFFSTSPQASLLFATKIAAGSALTIFAATTIAKVTVAKIARSVIQFSAVWQSVLLVSQFILQKSLGLWFLGERTFDASTVGIAHITVFGRELLRPYGTFPHPNVAAAFLVLSTIIILPSRLTALAAAASIVLTFARTAIVYLAVAAAVHSGYLKSRLIQIAAVMTAILFLPRLITTSINSVAERLILTQAALDIALKNPVVGAGSNNFILELSKLDLFSLAETRLLQPVHNVFLLILAENGIIGLVLFALVLLTFTLSVKGKTKTLLFIGLLIYASVDHFFWTLHQGQLLFWLTLAFIASKQK